MESLTPDFVQFSVKKEDWTGIMSTHNLEIFMKFPHILRF